jgi:hypothetical protein
MLMAEHVGALGFHLPAAVLFCSQECCCIVVSASWLSIQVMASPRQLPWFHVLCLPFCLLVLRHHLQK